jgi:hypothetical protein
MSQRENPVRIGDGPAAVTGDDRSIKPLIAFMDREGAAGRIIRESEDLPEQCAVRQAIRMSDPIISNIAVTHPK